MIQFKTLRWKNFLSTGNTFTELKMDKSPNTLVVGTNGAGKSTMLDALTFALFGKPFRNINKPTLVNSINNKDCVVEVDFKINKKSYKVIRGIKPAKFEIYSDGELVNQEAASKDYQAVLEEQILKTNYKTFTQIVILGSSSFVPFMQLSASERRTVIEDLLDIQIFSDMNILVKEKLSTLKSNLTEYKIRYDTVKEKIELHKKHIEEMKKNNQEMIDSKKKEIEENETEIENKTAEAENIQKEINKLLKEVTSLDSLRKKNTTLASYEGKIQANKSKVESEIEFYQDNDSCPTCKQSIETKHKSKVIKECEHKIKELDEGLSKLESEKLDVSEKIKKIQKVNDEITKKQSSISEINNSIRHTQKYNSKLLSEIQKLGEHKSISEETKKESVKLVDELTALVEKRKEAIEDKEYYDVAMQLLKDSGIKAKIVKQYLPIINKLVNKYLSAMDFFVNFEINEEFKESIKSRHRDEFSYENFSEGEKMRIDLALLFTWRSIAKMKNSMNCNILMLDEVFDSSLDVSGTEEFMKLINTLNDTNVFVISHKGDILVDKFKSVIKFDKIKNFSRIVQG